VFDYGPLHHLPMISSGPPDRYLVTGEVPVARAQQCGPRSTAEPLLPYLSDFIHTPRLTNLRQKIDLPGPNRTNRVPRNAEI